MRACTLLPDGTYELTNGDDIAVVAAEDLETAAAAFFAPRTPEELDAAKAIKRAAVAEQLAAAFDGGFTVPVGPMQGAVLQVRTQEDRTNWLTSQASYSTAVAMGAGDVLAANFRDASNTTRTITYREGLTVLMAMAQWGAAVMARSWVLKDQIAAAPNLETLNAIDVEAGWP